MRKMRKRKRKSMWGMEKSKKKKHTGRKQKKKKKLMDYFAPPQLFQVNVFYSKLI
jgi:hypothetical protein